MSVSAYTSTPLGPLFLSSDDHNITEISFINSFKSKKIADEQIDYSKPEDQTLLKCIDQLNEYFEGTRIEFSLPLKLNGTAFQNKVWNKLIEIPFGKSISYLQLSKQIDNVKAIRAVGTANGSNKIVIVVPCHRVIGSNGSLVGYGGDLWRKKWLLDHENKYANGVQKLF